MLCGVNSECGNFDKRGKIGFFLINCIGEGIIVGYRVKCPSYY